MNTLFGIGEEVFVKGIVQKIKVYQNDKGKVTVEYSIDIPSMLIEVGYSGAFREDNVYSFPVDEYDH